EVFGGGSETTATDIEWAMVELMRNPRIMKKAQVEIRRSLKGKKEVDEKEIKQLNFLHAIVHKTLRLRPLRPLLIRESREQCEINGYELPNKTRVLINVWAVGRDPNCWTNADCFKPERFLGSSITYTSTNFEYIPFGASKRMCLGISYAIATIEIVLAQLLYHFDWELPSGMKVKELNMTETYRVSARRRDDFYSIATPAQQE
ncbi:unnamed protein product, partial [Ilex paraguariensis]